MRAIAASGRGVNLHISLERSQLVLFSEVCFRESFFVLSGVVLCLVLNIPSFCRFLSQIIDIPVVPTYKKIQGESYSAVRACGTSMAVDVEAPAIQDTDCVPEQRSSVNNKCGGSSHSICDWKSSVTSQPD